MNSSPGSRSSLRVKGALRARVLLTRDSNTEPGDGPAAASYDKRHRGRPAYCVSVEAPTPAAYWIESYTLNIGMYIAITMKPTMPPTSTIMTGSRIDVSALIAAATSSS
jgi:hypothetical protein